jgi:hypothetical protein
MWEGDAMDFVRPDNEPTPEELEELLDDQELRSAENPAVSDEVKEERHEDVERRREEEAERERPEGAP